MLGESPFHVDPSKFLQAPSGECLPPLETCEFPDSSPRFLRGSYLMSFVDVRGSSIPVSFQ